MAGSQLQLRASPRALRGAPLIAGFLALTRVHNSETRIRLMSQGAMFCEPIPLSGSSLASATHSHKRRRFPHRRKFLAVIRGPSESPSGIDVQVCLGLLLRPMSSLVLAHMFGARNPCLELEFGLGVFQCSGS